MSLERGRSSSIDGQWIRENETKEFGYGYYSNDDEKNATYQSAVESLALFKMKNELLFNGMLEAKLRRFANEGITISKEEFLADIKRAVIRKEIEFDINKQSGMHM